MKKALTFLSLVALTMLFVSGSMQAQIRTGKGDFFNITRTAEQTADSVTFIADTLTLFDSGTGIGNFQNGDSVVVMFVQNRFKIVNNMLSQRGFDYIKARVSNTSTMLLTRQTYNGVVTITGSPLGNDAAPAAAKDVLIRPVYRPVGNIASSSNFNSGPAAIRQVLSMLIQTPDAGSDGIQIRNIYFKPNINNLTGLAVPPDTTKDTLRAYHLDGSGQMQSFGDVVSKTDLAIVRLLPGTTYAIMWVKDSAAAVDAGEYIGSFGDYSRGRYFLGDDGLPLGQTRTTQFRPLNIRVLDGVTVQNPDYGMIVDGFPPERDPIRYTNLFKTLAPFWYNESFSGVYPVLPGSAGSNPNPQNGLIPPYRPGAYAIVASRPYLPGIVSSAVDTLRFLDTWGNRTWDRMTQPTLKALAYTINTPSGEDRTMYLKGYQAADDTVRQFGQIVFRRLAYTHADVGVNAGGVEDSVRIVALADIAFTGQGGIPTVKSWTNYAYAQTDTSGGFPRTFSYSVRTNESDLDNGVRTNTNWNPEPNRGAVDPSVRNSLPYNGVKIVVRPNIPRAIDITPKDDFKGTMDANMLRVDITMTDGFGNTVDDNERFKFELSPFGALYGGNFPYRLNGIFDSLVATTPLVQISGNNIDSGRVYVSAANMGKATRIFRVASGSNNVGVYRIRVRSSYALNDKTGNNSDIHFMLKNDPNPGAGFLHTNDIPDGSPNNNFGVWFGPGTGYNGGFGRNMGQTVAMDSVDVIWDGTNWTYLNAHLPRVEVVTGNDATFVVGRVGGFTLPGDIEKVYDKLYVRITDIYGNPQSIESYFNNNQVKVELPDNLLAYQQSLQKWFIGSVSDNVAYNDASAGWKLSNVGTSKPTWPVGWPLAGQDLSAELVTVGAGQGLPGIVGDIPALFPYKAMRFYLRAPKNVRALSLAGTDKMRVRAHVIVNFPVGTTGDFITADVPSNFSEVSIIPDAVSVVRVFKSRGNPQGTTVPMEGWSPLSTADALAAGYSTGTPRNIAELTAFYTGTSYVALPNPVSGDMEPTTSNTKPIVNAAGGNIDGFWASSASLDNDCTLPVALDTVMVSEHNQQMRVLIRLLDKFDNPVGGRLVKFFVESETIPITPPKTMLQNNAQRGGFGEFSRTWVADDTVKRTTIGDTTTAGWVSAYYVSGRVASQFVRVVVTPDTLAFDLSSKGANLGEGTIIGPSRRGFAPRVVIPLYLKSDTTVRVQIYPYTAASTSPIPLPADAVDMQRFEPLAGAFSSNANMPEQVPTHFGRLANTNIRPYIPDTLNLTTTTGNNAITAGRTVTLVAREYDRFGNLVDNYTMMDDTARVRFRMWGDNFTTPPIPYNGASAGTIAPALQWTNDEYGPMRKIRFRHTQISNLVAGVHINQTSFLTALEYPTPRTVTSTVYFEATATAVLPPGVPGASVLNRDTIKVVSVVKTPTRFDILRAGQEYLQYTPGASAGVGLNAWNANPPESRGLNLASFLVNLPAGTQVGNAGHKFDAIGVDNVLVSQVYKRNRSNGPVGKYAVVNSDNVPIDKDGDPLFDSPTATTINPNFDVHPYALLPTILKRDAFNNDAHAAGLTAYNNIVNNPAIATPPLPAGARTPSPFDITIAGGGNIANPLTGESIGYLNFGGNNVNQRPVLFRITPVWENKPPRASAGDYGIAEFTGNNTQPGQTRTYSDRLYADSVYTYRGTTGASPANAAYAELMGTRSGANFWSNGRTRVGVSVWASADFTRDGLPNTVAFPANGPVLWEMYNGAFDRRVLYLGNAFAYYSGGTNAVPTLPGAYLRLIDSTSEQVVDLRVVDPTLTDGAGAVVDDTCSYDQYKFTVTRAHQRGGLIDDDTYIQTNLTDGGIQGPNNTNRKVVGNYPGITVNNRLTHTFVVVPYRIAYTSIFPSSFDVSQGLFDYTRLPLGILPVQADIDTLPHLTSVLYDDKIHDVTDFEMFTRLYGQIKHGVVDDRVNHQPGLTAPYARPDTVYRDIRYTYAVTPYDRYGNQNSRDTMFVQIGSRFTDWEFRDLEADGTLMIRSGGTYFGAIPKNTPTNQNYREDTLRIFNPRGQGLSVSRNDILGIKPDDKRLSQSVGSEAGNKIPHGLLPGNVIASRPVWVKMPYAPAPFVLSSPTLQNRSLFRMDHVGGCTADGLENDVLRLQWQASVWPTNSGQNNPNDTVKYEWYAIIDSVGGTSNSLTVSIPSDNEGILPSLTLPGDKLRQLIFRPTVQPQPNQDSLVMRVKWFVRAYSKTGLETYSDTAGATIRNTPLPTPPLVISINRPPATPPQAVQPANNATITGITATTNNVDVIWSPSTDINITKGNLIGGFKVYNPATQTWVTDAGRTVDTLTYLWVGEVIRTFPAGKGAPVGTTLVRSTGTTTGFQLTSADFDALFAGFDPDPASTSADSVKIDWYVYVKDFNFSDMLPMEEVTFRYDPATNALRDTTASAWPFSRFGCRPHELVGGPFRLNLTKLDQGGVEIDPMASDPDIDKIAGEVVCFKLTAKDKNGNIIRDWDQKGQATTIKLKGSTANSDTSMHSWNSDPLGYTFAVITSNGNQLTVSTPPDEFTIPATEFVNGVATICLTHTKAEIGITLETSPTLVGLNQVSAKMNFTAGEITNYLVDLTSATYPTPDQVYVERLYEVVVSPRDKFLNVSNAQIRTKFTARFPGEFDMSKPGTSNIFSGDVFITGPTNYFLTSTIWREKANDQLQTVRAYKFDDATISGETSPYEILKHAPNAFALTQPADKSTLKLTLASAQEQFKWVKANPQDPYTNIKVSRFGTNPAVSDVVTYKIVFLDSISLTRSVIFDSDQVGNEVTYTTNHGQLADLINQISGQATAKKQAVVWYAQATDGLFTTLSTPPTNDPNGRPGYRLELIKEGILGVNPDAVPAQYELSQNYPNPFNPTTSISYSLPKAGPVTIVVYDLLGSPVKTLVNETKEAGSFNVIWDATNDLGQQVPSGNYIYKIAAGSFTQTRKMTLLK